MFFILLSGIVVGGFSCRRNEQPLHIPQLVKLAEVRGFEGMTSVNYPGRIDASSNVKLAFRVAGPIRKMYVSEGQYVRKGQLLAELDPRDYRLQYDATQAEYEQVSSEADRVIELYRRGSVSINEYDKAVSAKKRVSALYQSQRNALNDTRLKAPFNGYIQQKYFSAPEIVNRGTPVLSMIDDDYFEVKVDIPTGDFIRREDFERFYAIADVYPDTLLPLELLDITQGANYNQLFTARFRLQRDGKLTLAPGMSVTVVIHFKQGPQGFAVVPVSALFQEEGDSYVWAYNEDRGTIAAVPVSVLRLTPDGSVVVKSGLRQGQQVVSAGVNDLKDGQKVHPLPPVSSSNVGQLL